MVTTPEAFVNDTLVPALMSTVFADPPLNVYWLVPSVVPLSNFKDKAPEVLAVTVAVPPSGVDTPLIVIVLLANWLLVIPALELRLPVVNPLILPLNVRLPEEFTNPDNVNPLTLPVPDTEVTVPDVLDVPAPMAVRKSEALSALTVLSALSRRKANEDGLGKVNKLLPIVVAPRLARPVAAIKPLLPPSHFRRSE